MLEQTAYIKSLFAVTRNERGCTSLRGPWVLWFGDFLLDESLPTTAFLFVNKCFRTLLTWVCSLVLSYIFITNRSILWGCSNDNSIFGVQNSVSAFIGTYPILLCTYFKYGLHHIWCFYSQLNNCFPIPTTFIRRLEKTYQIFLIRAVVAVGVELYDE